MSGLGSFNPEALKKLKEDYAQALETAESLEKAGISVGSNNLGVETSPIPSVWSNASLWNYPTGTKEAPSYENELSQVDFLTDAELQEIIEDLNTPVEEDLEEFAEVGLDDFDSEDLSVEEIRALAKTMLGQYQEDDDEEIPEDIDLDNITAEEFDNLIESILEEMGDDEDEDDDDDLLELDEIATVLLKELKDYDIDVLTLSEQDLYSLVESILFDEDEDEDPVSEKLEAIEAMIRQLKEEI
jgi:hypothetical protein